MLDYLLIAIFVIMISSVTILSILIVYYRSAINRLDEITLGRRVIVDHFLYQGVRATNYGFACTFEVLAKRTHPDVDFSQLPDDLKRPFRLMCRLLLIAIACMLVGGVWVQFV